MSSFAYWTDPVAAFSGQPVTDTTPQMIDKRGKIHPAPWVPFTRAGCSVGAFSIANLELENVGIDITTVFGPNSPEAQESAANPTKAMADFQGIAIHCAQGDALCQNHIHQMDLLPDEPGGYDGYQALFGNKYVQPAISPSGQVVDLDGNVITDSAGNVGFPSAFSPTATQALGYVATMLEAGVPVVYFYIADAHDNRSGPGTFGPGEAGFVAQLASYNTAFGKFFARLASDGITKANTLFIVTADEGDHFVGGPPSPANCDGVSVPCSYAAKGEVTADLSQVLATERGNTTPFTVHSDDAPTFYITGNPSQTDPITRQLEKDVGALVGVNPITGITEPMTAALADQAEQKFLHMVTADPRRTPTFVMFANPDYFLSATGNTHSCSPLASCFVEQSAFAWNHGDFQEQITRTWLGTVGPGVLPLGPVGTIFSDHTDIRPTMIAILGLQDDYAHDGRVLAEILDPSALPSSMQPPDAYIQLARAFKSINAPREVLGQATLALATSGVLADDAGYDNYLQRIAGITNTRDILVQLAVPVLDGAAFNGTPINPSFVQGFVGKANFLIGTVAPQ
jgi:hypothetical protein